MHITYITPGRPAASAGTAARRLAETGHLVELTNAPPVTMLRPGRRTVLVVEAGVPEGLATAFAYCQGLRRLLVPDPILLVLPAAALPAVRADWPVDDIVLDDSPGPELDARARRLGRRAAALSPSMRRVAGLTLDEHTLTLRAGERETALTHREFAILQVFLAQPDRVLRREELQAQVWGTAGSDSRGNRHVDTFICRLRHKIGPQGEQIETVRGVGYRFVTVPGRSAAA